MIIQQEKTNAQRFILAYNEIDQSLRTIYNFKRNMTFSDMIRRTVPLNSVVRKYEDKLIDYARLRNAIIHNSNEEYIIAEPHDEVVREIEKIAQLVTCPPLVINTVAKKNVLTITGEMPLKDVIILFASSGFKSLPVYFDGRIMGIATPIRLIEWLGEKLKDETQNPIKVLKTPILETLREDDIEVRYCIRSEKLTIQEALDIFFNNRKMSSIILTKTGNFLEHISGMITVADVIDLNKILEDYD
mgnify:CR=1 FL=1